MECAKGEGHFRTGIWSALRSLKDEVGEDRPMVYALFRAMEALMDRASESKDESWGRDYDFLMQNVWDMLTNVYRYSSFINDLVVESPLCFAPRDVLAGRLQ